ncbi:unnamed protein product [Linum tenue]|uniref:Uncharacterized protein n=1 Tax=Linum tenue TaxID=586396 RepID=A0AAV0LLW8_9ROSI|nr:unnamed protein product [Linum tenue]
MRSRHRTRTGSSNTVRKDFRNIMKCFCSGQQLVAADEMVPGSGDTPSPRYHTASARSSRSSKSGEAGLKPDASNIEEAELSLRGRGSLNNEEARALLGRIEYQKGNFEAALQVFEGIDPSAVTPKIKSSIARHGDQRRRPLQNYNSPPLSMHAISLLLEAVFLKAKSLQHLARFEGTLLEKKGLLKEALKAFIMGLSIDPVHVPSLVSTTVVLRKLGGGSNEILRSFLMGALRLDRLNIQAWYNLGLVHRDEGSPSSLLEAAECFEAATLLEETEPVEPFR